MTGLGFSVAAAQAGAIMPDCFVNEILVDLGAEHVVAEIHGTDYLIAKIEYVNSRHDYRLALRTMT
jgi:hypothetical protein